MTDDERLFNENDLINLVSVINKIIKKYYIIDDVEQDSENEEEVKMLKSYVLIKDIPVYNSEKKKFCMTHAGAQTLLLFAALLLCVCAWFLGSTVGAK
jgi:hypothetical protein